MGTHRRSPRGLIALGGLCFLTSLGTGCVTNRAGAPAVESTPSGLPPDAAAFTEALSPYGQWMDLEGVGTVWRPSPEVVGSDFIPYATGGQWALGDEGWTFESDWNWGWAPFHYGRWLRSAEYGWVWAPGNEWAPAWVDWRTGDDFIGWAPLPPSGFAEDPTWIFVSQNDFVRPHVYRYRLPPERSREVYHRATPVAPRDRRPGVHWSSGPEPSPVERATGSPVPRSRLHAPRAGEAFGPGVERPGGPVHSASPVGPARPMPREERIGPGEMGLPPGAPVHAATPPAPGLEPIGPPVIHEATPPGPAFGPVQPQVHEATPPQPPAPAAGPGVHAASPPHSSH